MGLTMTPIPGTAVDTILTSREKRMWVFGYGSLVWKTGFEYTSSKIGYIDGYVRRFWQGDNVHRGTNTKPGRVATLEKDDSGNVWGVAFELVGQKQIEDGLQHLGMRECTFGGYDMEMIPFFPRDNVTETLSALLFVATPENNNYLGRASTEDIAKQIVPAKGKAGYNVEYVTRLADFMRENIPESQDSHLFDLDSSIRRILRERQIHIDSLLTDSQINYSYMNGIKPNASLQKRPAKRPFSVLQMINENSNLPSVPEQFGQPPKKKVLLYLHLVQEHEDLDSEKDASVINICDNQSVMAVTRQPQRGIMPQA